MLPHWSAKWKIMLRPNKAQWGTFQWRRTNPPSGFNFHFYVRIKIDLLAMRVLPTCRHWRRKRLRRSGVTLNWRLRRSLADYRLHFNMPSFSFHPPPPLPRDLDEYPPRPPQYCCCWYCSFDMAFLISHYKEDNMVVLFSKDALAVWSTTACKQWGAGQTSVPC